jgi:hypothetical protein
MYVHRFLKSYLHYALEQLKKNTKIYFYELVQNKYFPFLKCDHPYIKVSAYVELFLRRCNQGQL